MKTLRFITPVDGDMISDAAGNVQNGALEIEVQIAAPPDSAVTVNGICARWTGSCYAAVVPLKAYRNVLTAVCGCGTSESAVVYRLKHAAGKFALSVDDNIWAFADLTKNKDIYTSIFENPYLRVYQKAHEKYGTTVRLNMFYSSNNPCGLEMYGPFDLSMMTDKFRDEFRANADWLHLAFHAQAEFPDRPYACADYAQMQHDYKAVAAEICRFAGDEVLDTVTTNHWGSGSREAVRAEKDLGLRALMGYLELDRDGRPYVSYELTPEQVKHANEYGFWKDHETDMIYGKIDLVLNLYDAETARRLLDAAKAAHPKKGFVEVMIHEQYFYPAYKAYLPDYAQRIFSACRWCRENGYTPAFTSGVLFE